MDNKLDTNIETSKNLLFSKKKEEIDVILHDCYLNKICHWKESKKMAAKALFLSEEINYEEGRGIALLELGYQNWFEDSLEIANSQLTESSEILISCNNEFMYARSIAVRASIYWTKGDRTKAITILFEALNKIGVQNKNTLWIIWFSGIFYFDIQDYKNSEFQYLHALSIIKSSERETPDAYAYCIIGLGGVLMKTGQKEQAIEYFYDALEFCQKNGYWMQEARVLNELGLFYESSGETSKAINFFQKSYVIRKEQQTKPALITSLLSLARVTAKNDVEEAIVLAEKALKLAELIDSKPKLLACHKMLTHLKKMAGNLTASYAHLELSEKLGEKLAGNATSVRLKNLEKDFVEELFRRERDALSLQNSALEKANKIIKTQYKEISDSIDYAKKIQNAILPPLNYFSEQLPDLFLIYLPKATVSGDFYWLESVDEDHTLFAVADCTGHGVPGAMTSMLCIGALNRAVREFNLTQPAEILTKTRDIIISDFSNSNEELHEGMDISLCLLNSKTGELQWAGAFNPLYIIRSGSDEIEELVANKQPIGKYPTNAPFTNHEITVSKGDQLYLFSDGFADQFGGERDKKYTTKRFKKLMTTYSQLPLEDQKTVFINTLDNWKGDNDQIDDICILGIRI